MSGPGGPPADAPVVPRILTIMGSGETAPTMAKVHRELFGRLGRPPVPAVLLDTPYGFQENADEITERTLEYFRDNIGYPMTLATFRSQGADALVRATAVARARAAHYLFAGPGSPSYALAQWRGSEVPSIVADKLRYGGIVTFASAAALTLGSHTVPVYEIYKAGEPPRWLDGSGPARRARAAGRGHPPLRQRGGGHPRHPLLLPRRTSPGDAGVDAARGALRVGRRLPHGPGTGFRRGDRHGHGYRLGDHPCAMATARSSRRARPCPSVPWLRPPSGLPGGRARHRAGLGPRAWAGCDG